MLVVSDLRQYTYCPRIVYYRYCLPTVRPVTYKMEAGKEAHGEEADRERRRGLRTYGLVDGERVYDVWLEDEGLGLRGKLDMAIIRTTEVIPVEYKDSPGRMGRHVLLQLVGYALLLERAYGRPAHRGFVYHIPARRARECALDGDLRESAVALVNSIGAMIADERMPAPTPQRSRCELCEFSRFCNDVV